LLNQRTVKSTIHGHGVALHSGAQVRFHIIPARAGTGVVFVRTDLTPHVEIPATAEHVVETRLATTLGHQGVTVGTVEHLMSALYGLGIDNARIEIDGPEVPILDGSAAPFVELIQEAGGAVGQGVPRKFLVVKESVGVWDHGRTARLEPASAFEINCTIDFDHPLIGDQRFDHVFSDQMFLRDVCRARTFGFARDVALMQSQGLALGGSLDNAVVIDDFSVQNPDGLRYPDEFVRHKVLDAIGDLALLGAPLIGRFVGVKSGHALNTRLVSSILARPWAFELVEARPRDVGVDDAVLEPAPLGTRLAIV